VRGPTGALLIGDAETVAEKILYVNEVLGGLSRITFQMGVSTLPHQKMLRAIEILATQVAPIVQLQTYFEYVVNLWLSFVPEPLKSKFPRNFSFPVTVPFFYQGDLPPELGPAPQQYRR
jgi:hypothetical protein